MFSKKLSNLVIYICIAITGIITTMTSPLLIELSNLTNTPIENIGIIYTFNTIGYLTFSILSSIIVQKSSPKRLISIIMIFYSFAMIMLPKCSTIVYMCVVFLFIGAGNGSLMGLVTVYIKSMNRDKSCNYVNNVHMYYGIGAILGPVLVCLFEYNSIEWKYIYIVISMLTFVVAILFLKVKNCEVIISESISPKNIRSFSFNKYLILIAMCVALYDGAEVGSWGWLSTSLKMKDISIISSNMSVSLFWLWITIGRALIAKINNKFKVKNIVLFFTALSVVSNILINIETNTNYYFIFISLLGLSYSAICPLLISLGLEVVKDVKKEYITSSVLLSSGSIGIMIIPYLMGRNIIGNKYFPAVALTICFVLISISENIKKEVKFQRHIKERPFETAENMQEM